MEFPLLEDNERELFDGNSHVKHQIVVLSVDKELREARVSADQSVVTEVAVEIWNVEEGLSGSWVAGVSWQVDDAQCFWES